MLNCNLYYLNIREGDVWCPPGRDLAVFECYRCKVCCRRNMEKNNVFAVVGIRNKMTFTWCLAIGWNKNSNLISFLY